MTPISADIVAELATRVTGEVVTPAHPGYDESRALWNGMIDRHPAVIVRCATTGDVATTIAFARANGLPLAIRGGGHNVAGSASCDGGVVVDLGPLDRVEVDADARRARVGGGARWGAVDTATEPYGLVTPGGVVSDTGVAGLTLGGGMGWIRRAHGLSCDALVGAQVVTADGEVVRADAGSHPDLFWALKGGGGNFGVVTEFEFELYPLGPEVATVFVAYPFDHAADVIAAWRDLCQTLPDEVSSLMALGSVPADDEFPAETHGQPAVMVLALAVADPATGTQLMEPLRTLAAPLADLSGTSRYVEWQKVYDEDYPSGDLRYYWKSIWVDDLSDEAIERLAAATLERPSEHTTIDIWHQGGAIARVSDAESSFGNRQVPWLVNPESNWERAEDDEANIGWTRGVVDSVAPWSATGGAYLNFAGLYEDEELVEASYGATYARLAEVKRTYDPENVFRINPNVSPSS